jgi:hypothetical protein
MHTVDMVAAGCGNFSFYCSVADHLEHGMMSNFVVKGGARGCPRQTRSYNREAFIQAEEYEWDYAVRGQGCEGAFTDHELEYLGNGDDRIGRKYIKARFRAFTDATFTCVRSRLCVCASARACVCVRVCVCACMCV